MDKKLNPWFSMWIKPRATIQQVVDDNPKRLVHILAWLAGVGTILNVAAREGVGLHNAWPWIVLMAVIMGAIIGSASLYVMSYLTFITGRWLGGRASLEHVRAARAWANVPLVWGLLLWVFKLLIFGQDAFIKEASLANADLLTGMVAIAIMLATAVISIWHFFTWLKCLAQVQGFSVWKGLGNHLLGVVLPLTVLVVALLLLKSLLV